MSHDVSFGDCLTQRIFRFTEDFQVNQHGGLSSLPRPVHVSLAPSRGLSTCLVTVTFELPCVEDVLLVPRRRILTCPVPGPFKVAPRGERSPCFAVRSPIRVATRGRSPLGRLKGLACLSGWFSLRQPAYTYNQRAYKPFDSWIPNDDAGIVCLNASPYTPVRLALPDSPTFE